MRIGIVGAGNMGGAVCIGLCKAGYTVSVFDVDQIKCAQLAKECGATGCTSLQSIAETCLVLVLAVKPQVLQNVIDELNDHIQADTVVISLAAGWGASRLEEAFGGKAKTVRIMPNTPALIGQGAIVISQQNRLSEKEKQVLTAMMETVGKVYWVEESKMDAVTSISGSGPAYVFMMIEALSQAGEKQGLSKELSLALATQTFLGASAMVQHTNAPPADLKKAVCSPGGTTIEAVLVFEQDGLYALIDKAVSACANKSRLLSGQ